MPRAVIVGVPKGHKGDLKQAQSILAKVLGELGCGMCFSGRDIHFVEEIELISFGEARITPKALQGVEGTH